ncbi:MAG: hypothetical protein A2289_01085 [Deltaproteobacteria bacterium RIFOXYA12_FULL_58_15]|nr:MAG: hypothetical protein A2289_01085 [Deltaproteobacteria bacterium RIFOXYA12_FULL_58_15]OGR14731.1 MAG: hypothetical protein A2341_05130 [Deltaproteobacteria bacterium RIFOXYB12_FULL_58_9]
MKLAFVIILGVGLALYLVASRATWRDVVIYVGTFLFSLLAHWGLIGGLSSAARMAPPEKARVLEFAVVESPPPPTPEPEPEKPKPKPKAKPIDLTSVVVPDTTPPPPNEAGETELEEAKPVFGITMSSVVGPGSGAGMSVRVGNTTMKAPEQEFTDPNAVKAYKPVPLYKVTKRPTFTHGICKPDYPPEPKRLGIEGRVQLSVELRSDGTVGEVKVVEGLGYGLDEAAVKAIKNCPFEPANIGGEPVTTTITVGVSFVIED